MADRRRQAALLALLLVASGCKQAWPHYEAPDATFSVEIPPPLRTDAERSEGSQRLLAVESRPAEDQAFLLQRRRPAPGRHLEAEGVLDGFCAEFARARGYETTTDVRGKRRDGRPAQTCAFHGAQLEIRIQVVAAGQCIYTLMAMWRGPAPDVDRFFDGFRVLKDCQAD